jgi:hypothetical protein
MSHFLSQSALAQSERSVFPVGALNYLNRHVLPSRTFTDYAWGGYLLWKGSPRYQDFIDGRANTLFDATILDAYLRIYGASPEWKRDLAQYKVDTVLVDPGAPLAQVLSLDSSWRRIFADQMAVVYTRR